MPRPITRADAIRRAAAERPPGCLICALRDGLAGPTYELHRSEHAIAVLSRYPRSWGQAMVLLCRHAVRFTDVSEPEWEDANRLALMTARRLEEVRSPLRCYVSSLGTHRTDLPMSSPHIHLHVDPIYDPSAKPSTVFTMQPGLLEADEAEWEELRASLAW